MQPILAWDNLGQAPPGWGSHVLARWDQFEPQPGVYRFDIFDQAFARCDRLCHVQIYFSVYDKALGAPVDYTPAAHKRSLKLTVGARTGEIPPYDAAWTEAYGRAIEALAQRYKAHPQVVGYWHAAGWNQETQAAVATTTGDWAAAVQPQLKESVYLNFITHSTQRAVAAWSPVPVYLPGAPSPGGVWRHKRRDVLAAALTTGAGYLNCGLVADIGNAWGVGEYAGLGLFEMAMLTPRRGFEEGPRRARGEPMELYWLLLNVLHFEADFVNLYGSLSAPEYAMVEELLPRTAAWIVFRDQEYRAQVYQANGKRYGFSGVPGCWARGAELRQGVPVFNGPEQWSFDRWTLPGPAVVAWPGLADGPHQWRVWGPAGAQTEITLGLKDGLLTLPNGIYHRVDWLGAVMMTLEERVTALEERIAVLEHTFIMSS